MDVDMEEGCHQLGWSGRTCRRPGRGSLRVGGSFSDAFPSELLEGPQIIPRMTCGRGVQWIE